MGRKLLVLALVIFATSTQIVAEDSDDDDAKEEMEIYKIALEFVDECGSKEFSLCIKERALKYVVSLPSELDIGETIKVKPNGRFSRKTEIGQLPDEPRAREDAVDSILWEKVSEYLGSHTIEIKLPPDTLEEMKNSVDEGRGKSDGGEGGKKGDRMRGLMMLIQLKLAILGALALKFVALVAFKALILAKVALTISAVIALKKLLEHKQPTSTYEVVAHPHVDEWGHHSRSSKIDQLAYRGYEGGRSKS